MRFAYLFMGLVCATVLFLSNTVKPQKALFISGDKEPNLPEVPYTYNYDDIEFGSYLVQSNPVYYGPGNDTILLENVTDEGATLGRVLFYDELLSANENLSCATCHKQELSFSDDTPFSDGVNELTTRNSIHLNDLGWSNNYAFFWDMSHSNLKDMIALPLNNENEVGITDIVTLIGKMEATGYYESLFEAAYGDSGITQDRIQDALAQFIASFNTLDSKFDRVNRGEAESTTREEMGEELFVANCSSCHWQGTPLTVADEYPEGLVFNSPAFNNRLAPTSDQGAGSWGNTIMNGAFKSPTLRNLKYTAPYMHDGRFNTLEEVIDHYSEGADEQGLSRVPLGGYHFTALQKEALLDFLDTFNDDSFVTNVKWSDPFALSTATEELPIQEETVNVFPNPSSGLTNVVFANIGIQKVDAYLMNIEGKMLRQFSTHKNGFQTDVSQLSPGTYIVRIKNGDRFIDKKLIVQ